MYKRRLIPVLYLKNGWMVRSEGFEIHQIIGDPIGHVERMVQWDVDELVVLNIGAADSAFQHDRDDYKNQPIRSLLEFITKIAVDCCIPLTFGGHIVSVEDVALRIANGADKVAMNTALADAPQTVTAAARRFGSQAVVASIDYRLDETGTHVFVERGNRDIASNVVDWARHAEQLGAGEILLNAIDRDGCARGYDLETISAVVEAVAIPVIVCGGAGHQRHFRECFQKTGASAVAAGNIFHFTENAYPRAKAFLKQTLADIR